MSRNIHKHDTIEQMEDAVRAYCHGRDKFGNVAVMDDGWITDREYSFTIEDHDTEGIAKSLENARAAFPSSRGYAVVREAFPEFDMVEITITLQNEG